MSGNQILLYGHLNINTEKLDKNFDNFLSSSFFVLLMLCVVSCELNSLTCLLNSTFSGHHTIYIGVHVPKSYRRRRRHRRRTSHKDKKEKVTENASDRSDAENNEEASNSILKPLSKRLPKSRQFTLILRAPS